MFLIFIYIINFFINSPIGVSIPTERAKQQTYIDILNENKLAPLFKEPPLPPSA